MKKEDFEQKYSLQSIELQSEKKKAVEFEFKKQELDKKVDLIKVEYEAKLKIEQQKKEESSKLRESFMVMEQKKTYEIDLAKAKSEIENKQEELKLYQNKLQSVQTEFNLLKDTSFSRINAENTIKELQQQNYVITTKLAEAEDKIKKALPYELTPEERKEVAALERLLAGYQKDNESKLEEIKKLKKQILDNQRFEQRYKGIVDHIKTVPSLKTGITHSLT